jgi:hypothetical protein
MRGIVFSISALLCVLIFAPPAPAQQNIYFNNDFVVENACDPNPPEQEFEQLAILPALDSDQVEMVRIQLLERGFDPGFDPYRDNTIDAQLIDALAEFQAEYELPVTGQPDVHTLDALSIPTQGIQYEKF